MPLDSFWNINIFATNQLKPTKLIFLRPLAFGDSHLKKKKNPSNWWLTCTCCVREELSLGISDILRQPIICLLACVYLWGVSVHLHIFHSSCVSYHFGLKATGKWRLHGNSHRQKWKLMLWSVTAFHKIIEAIRRRKFQSCHAMKLTVLPFSSVLLSSITSSWGHRSQNYGMAGDRKLWLPGDCPLTAGYSCIFK